MKVVIANGPGFETDSLIRSVVQRLWHPILNRLPVGMRTWIGKSCPWAARMVFDRTTYKALEAMYLYSPDTPNRTIFTPIWEGLTTVRATRNRLKLVQNLLLQAYSEVVPLLDGEPLQVTSVAAGSARAVVETLAFVSEDVVIHGCFLDAAEDAIEYSKRLAEMQLVERFKEAVWSPEVEAYESSNARFSWRQGNVTKPQQLMPEQSHVIEMVGLLDYFKHRAALKLLKELYLRLAPGGVLLVGNIKHNPESPFVNKIIGWNMVERTPTEFHALLVESGFPADDIVVYLEPLEVHMVAVCRKPQSSVVPLGITGSVCVA